MREFPPPAFAFRLSGEEYGFSRSKFLQHPSLIEPGSADVRASTIQQRTNQSPATGNLPTVQINDSPPNRLHLVFYQLLGGANFSQVEDIAGDVQQKIVNRLNS
jgi:hypothetical protein